MAMASAHGDQPRRFMTHHPTSIGARWILPVSRPPLRDAALRVAGGVIREVVPGGRRGADRDAGDVVLMPGLVNTHTHLEFSDLRDPIGQPGVAITDWIPRVIGHRRKPPKTGDPESAVLRGIGESLASGTVAVGEIATTPWFTRPDSSLPGASLPGASAAVPIVCFVERLGHQRGDVAKQIGEAAGWLDEIPESADRLPGLSPHAPYSLSDELLAGVVEMAVQRQLPLAMHLAESTQEMQWLAGQQGQMSEMLESLGVAARAPAGRRPLEYLRILSRAKRCLVIHGNYLDKAELQFLAGRGGQMHLVYCPRTHEFFGHPRWPLVEALGLGVPVALGTDSRASSPDLNMWSELRTVARLFPEIPAATILHLGTLGGARALGLEKRVGCLEAGRAATFQTIPIDVRASDPAEALLREDPANPGSQPVHRTVN